MITMTDTQARALPVAAIDRTALGEMMLRLPAIAAAAGHASLKSTADYAGPLPGREAEVEFIQDMLAMKVGPLVDKWYGGQQNAAQILTDLRSKI